MRSIEQTTIMSIPGEVELFAAGVPSASFNPLQGPLTVRINDQQMAGVPGDGYAYFYWNGDNANGQALLQGLYFVKLTMRDTYNTVTTVIKTVNVIRADEYSKAVIYNTAGEIVRVLTGPWVDPANMDLQIPDVFAPGGGSTAQFTFGDGGMLQWDGKNFEGALVATGEYIVKVEVRAADGFTVTSNKTMTVIRQNPGTVLGEVKCYPNPYVVVNTAAGNMRFAWTGTGPGRVNIKIYNAAGELVTAVESPMSALSADWNMKTMYEGNYASGFYIAVIEGVLSTGEKERKAVKLAILRKF